MRGSEERARANGDNGGDTAGEFVRMVAAAGLSVHVSKAGCDIKLCPSLEKT